MQLKTHLKINSELCGALKSLEEGCAEVELLCTEQMAADEEGLIHGGFLFGAADFAAMAAVNAPNVVLTASECRFLAPSRIGDVIVFEARVIEEDGAKAVIEVVGRREEKRVFSGSFKSYITDEHVLKG